MPVVGSVAQEYLSCDGWPHLCDHRSMRIALISDIHGNSVALDAVVAELPTVDRILCLGDVAANGPDPSGVVARLGELGAITVMGNTDAGLVEMPPWWFDPSSVGVPADAHPGIEIGVWCASEISPAEKGFLSALPLTVELDLGDAGRLLGFHGSPRSFDEIIKGSTPEDQLDQIFAGHDQEVLAGGHTHVPLLRRLRGQTMVNPGSVGLPFSGYGYAGGVVVLAHASYGIIETREGAISIEIRQTPIDLVRLEELVRTSDMPHAAWWLDRWRYPGR